MTKHLIGMASLIVCVLMISLAHSDSEKFSTIAVDERTSIFVPIGITLFLSLTYTFSGLLVRIAIKRGVNSL
jgi:hypothetical protein